MSPGDRDRVGAAPPEIIEQLDIQARYDGYVRRQLAEVRRQRATETLAIPEGFDFGSLDGLTFEAKDKLARLRPMTLGQASRISGVSPADISVLMVHLHRAGLSNAVSATSSAPRMALAETGPADADMGLPG
jgi:tRNA uridine 5-carboxymethylaminomethyl modification enzyme